MENYYIEVEQQGSIVEMFRIKANSEEQAERIARQLMLENYDFNFVSADQMASDYDRIPIIDENGEEVAVDELEEDEEWVLTFEPDDNPDEEEMQEVEEDDRQNGIKSTFMLNHWIVVGPKSKLLELVEEYDLDENEYTLERKEG